jgi:branched-chain amino acid transport system permease protein
MLKHIGLFLVIVFSLAGLNWLVTGQLNDYAQSVLLQAGIYVILAVSLNLVNGFTGQFSLGQAGFFGIGAYAAAALTVYGQLGFLKHWFGPYSTIGLWPGTAVLLLAMTVGGLAAAIAGLLVGLPSLKLRGDYLAIVTLGMNQIIVVILNNMDVVGGPRGFGEIFPANHDPVSIPKLTTFFWVYLVAAAVIMLSLNIRKSVHGLAFMAIREDEVAAEAMGVPTTRYKIIAFVLSALFAGIAGALYAHNECYITPTEFDFTISINIVVMVVLGGMGSVSGTAIAALVLWILPEVLRQFDQYRLVVYAAMLIILMLVRPKGIFGQEELSILWLKHQSAAVTTYFSKLRNRGRSQTS